MKPIFRLLFICFVFSTNPVTAQTVLVSTPLELKKGSEFHQALNAVDTKTNEVYAFAADNEKIHLFHYNSAFFLRDTLTLNQPDKQYAELFGYGFEDDKPILLLAGDDLKKIQQVSFDVKNKTTSVKMADFIPDNEDFLGSFSQDNVFYAITSVAKAQNLKLYIFKNGYFSSHVIDFSGYELADAEGKPITFSAVADRFPIRKMESQSVNPLTSGISKSKLFTENGRLILTIDSNPKLTYVFEISLIDFSIIKTEIPQVVLSPENPKLSQYSNSYYHNGKLYQLKFNDEKLAFSSKLLKDPSTPIAYEFAVTDTRAFNNTPFLSQTGYRQPSEISLKRFFRKLATSEAGLTVYTTADKTVLITVGGVRKTITTGNAILGVALGAGSIAVGGGADVVDLFDNDTAQSVYFESVFDEDFKHLEVNPDILADDYISEFLDENNQITTRNVFPFRDFFVLGYYDRKAKQYVLRKFRDGGVD